MCFNRLAYINIYTSSGVVQTYGVFDHLVEDKASKCCSTDTQQTFYINFIMPAEPCRQLGRYLAWIHSFHPSTLL
jgi:hypothetical protein